MNKWPKVVAPLVRHTSDNRWLTEPPGCTSGGWGCLPGEHCCVLSPVRAYTGHCWFGTLTGPGRCPRQHSARVQTVPLLLRRGGAQLRCPFRIGLKSCAHLPQRPGKPRQQNPPGHRHEQKREVPYPASGAAPAVLMVRRGCRGARLPRSPQQRGRALCACAVLAGCHCSNSSRVQLTMAAGVREC